MAKSCLIPPPHILGGLGVRSVHDENLLWILRRIEHYIAATVACDGGCRISNSLFEACFQLLRKCGSLYYSVSLFLALGCNLLGEVSSCLSDFHALSTLFQDVVGV